METVRVAAHEGDEWIKWGDWVRSPNRSKEDWRVHAILFEDGSVWDAVNGFRKGQKYCTCCGGRVGY